MIRITFKNGKAYEWGDESCKEYKYDGKCFIVIGHGRRLGIYNMDDISSVEVAPQMGGANVMEEDAAEEGAPAESEEK